MFKSVDDLPQEVDKDKIVLLDLTLFRDIAFGSFFPNGNNVNNYQRIRDALENGKIKNAATLDRFGTLLDKVLKIPRSSYRQKMWDWIENFKTNQNIIYTIPDMPDEQIDEIRR